MCDICCTLPQLLPCSFISLSSCTSPYILFLACSQRDCALLRQEHSHPFSFCPSTSQTLSSLRRATSSWLTFPSCHSTQNDQTYNTSLNTHAFLILADLDLVFFVRLRRRSSTRKTVGTRQACHAKPVWCRLVSLVNLAHVLRA